MIACSVIYLQVLILEVSKTLANWSFFYHRVISYSWRMQESVRFVALWTSFSPQKCSERYSEIEDRLWIEIDNDLVEVLAIYLQMKRRWLRIHENPCLQWSPLPRIHALDRDEISNETQFRQKKDSLFLKIIYCEWVWFFCCYIWIE